MITPADIRAARILIVDDSAVNVSLLERMLVSAGYTSISTTTDSRTVVSAHLAHPFDIILLDLLMPDMDGFAVMRALDAVETEGYLSVLVLTAQPEHKVRALSAGAKDFISKPFNQHEVLTRIYNMLQVRLLLREARSYSKLLEQYDQLTGLPNRRLFREHVVRAVARAGEGYGVVSVVFVAVDRFADVNDALGRTIGGALLRTISNRLVGCVGPGDMVARLDGSEFAVLTISPQHEVQGGRATAIAIREALREPLEWDEHTVSVTATMGIAVAPVDTDNSEDLLKFAHTALHAAKREGGDTFRFFSEPMNAESIHHLALENALRNALGRGEFVLHYQPKMRLDSGDWSGVEALLRWDRPGYGLVPPSTFIPILEETGLIVPVGAWVIDTVCQQLATWKTGNTGISRVAVNVSGRQFLRTGFASDVSQTLRKYGVDASSLDIEITETSLMARTQDANVVLRELKALGVWISIDDFGTGYSSLAYLRHFPIDALKIDISFIHDVTTSPDGAALAIAIINMARSLKMTVVAEGVETEPQLLFLREHACDEIQGYFCSRPLPPTELAVLRGDMRHARALTPPDGPALVMGASAGAHARA